MYRQFFLLATQILQMCANGNEDPGMDVLVEESLVVLVPIRTWFDFV